MHVISEDMEQAARSPGPLADARERAPIRILVVDDEHTLRESCASFLQSIGHVVEVSGRGEDALRLLQTRRYDIVLLDLHLPDVSGMSLLQACLEKHPATVVIIMTGKPSVDSSLAALQKGAWDYLTKPFSATQFEILIGRAAHKVRIGRGADLAGSDTARLRGLREPIAVLGVSPAFQAALELARKVARTDASVFITGDSGTGKEMIAQFIHQNSRRNARPMVSVNCAALPESLLESEMFGHRKGAFTGAVRDKPGLLETANGGTFFLDELGNMSKSIQSKLLRVIQDGMVRRVGSETVDATVDVRFITATNRDPEESTASGDLREDLYYRLCVVPIRLPPLRERPEDIPILADYFLRYYWARHGPRGAPLPKLSTAALRALGQHPWRGNVRELQNVIEHSVVLLEPGAEVQPENIPLGRPEQPSGTPSEPAGGPLGDETYHAARERVMGHFEQRYLTTMLKRAAGNMSRAARLAGIDRTTLYRLMEKHGLQREATLADNP